MIFLMPLLITAQNEYNPHKKYSPQQFTEDFDYLVSAFQKAHPSVYWQTDSLKFKETIELLRVYIASTDSLTELEFFRRAALINELVRCSHSYVWPSVGFEKWWEENALLIPFNLIEAKGKYYILQNYSNNPQFKFGTEILAIDDKPIQEIINEIWPYIPVDRNNMSRKNHALKTGFYSYYSFLIKVSSTQYKVLCAQKGEIKTLNLKGISKKQLDERRNLLKKPVLPLSFKTIDSLDAALLTITTFRKDLFESAGLDFKTALDSVFTILKEKNISSLIIDLRDNTGGNSEYGAVLLEHIASKPFEYCKNLVLTSDTLIPGITYDIAETFPGFPAGIELEDSRYLWKNHPALGIRQPTKNAFSGNVFFIINGKGMSTTSEVATVARENKMGVFIGEEVGGTYKGNTSGVMGTVTLPHTKLTATIAMVKYELAVTGDNAGHGVIPEYLVEKNLLDYIIGYDVELNTAINLIIKKK